MKMASTPPALRPLLAMTVLAAALAACSPSPAPQVAAPATEAAAPKAPAKAAAAKPVTQDAAAPAPATAPPAEQVAQQPPPPPKSVCAVCGTVQAVTPIEVKGEAKGGGAVAGAVLGGVIGHQMGGGRGKTAMTVIGAAGGGLAGNEAEKRYKSTTRYQLQIRMDDGSTRTVTQDAQLMVGQKVTVQDGQVSPAQ
jgi:outer membrane lipoprotein SlyB